MRRIKPILEAKSEVAKRDQLVDAIVLYASGKSQLMQLHAVSFLVNFSDTDKLRILRSESYKRYKNINVDSTSH